jgi:hypothetical protein
MKQKVIRGVVGLVLVLASGGVGYSVADTGASHIASQTITAPAAGTTRIIYSLEHTKADQEIIALIDAAKEHIYFAIYTFTLPSIADALVEAKKRGVEVRGVVDAGQAASGYGAPIIQTLVDGGVSVVTEKHESGNGIMHIKALVTETAYATGSYNWTNSATTINDEVIEIGTDETLRKAYEDILLTLLDEYRGNDVTKGVAATKSAGTIDYTEAGEHIGETASVRGVLVKAHTSSSGTVFLDFCQNYKTCPFTAVIFADDAKKFGDLSKYNGSTITVTGKISSYQGKAEIILSSPSQLSQN